MLGAWHTFILNFTVILEEGTVLFALQIMTCKPQGN
jgi:hypothetical protein